MKRAVFAVIFFTFLTLIQSDVTTTVTEDVEVSTSTDSSDDIVTENATILEHNYNESCDVNNTACNLSTTLETAKGHTDKNNITNETNTPTILPSFLKLPEDDEVNSKTKICSCDLQLQICDINCCCDEDCTYENKLIFAKCDNDENRFYDANYCKYSMYIYKNNTEYEWEIHQNWLFCIEKSNLPESYSVHKKLAIKSVEEAELQKTNKYYWSPVEVNETDPKFMTRSRLTFGQNIWISKNYSTIELLELPDRLVTGLCLAKRAVTFLENIKTKCASTIISKESRSLNLENFVQNLTVFSQSTLINTRWNETHFKWTCPKNICVPMVARVCVKNFENCSMLAKPDDYKLNCKISLYDNENVCNNLVRKIKYVFYHNGTHGIQKWDTFFVLENVTFDLKGNVLYMQEFEVNYFWLNYTLNYSSIRSGNPGYIIGKFILTANLLAIANAGNGSISNITYLMRRHDADLADNLMIFPANENGFCVFSNSTNIPVEFGFNMILKCRIKEKLQAKKNSTAKELCSQIQQIIFHYWSIKLGNASVNITKQVGNFGNANSSNSKEWSAVSYNIKPTQLLNSTVGGNFSREETMLSCNNIYTHLKVDFYHGREVVSNLHNQEKILWTSFRFENGRSFKWEMSKWEVHFEVDLRNEVMFFDVTTEKVKKFADPPKFEIKLPYDFFYPFIKVGSNGCACAGENYCLKVLYLVIVLLYFN